MTQSVRISDVAYRALQTLAERQGEPPETIVERLIASALPDDGPYYETEEWFRHLGVSEERIRRARERAEQDSTDA